MGAIQVKAPSTQGTRSRLARAQPRAKTADPEGLTSRPRVPSSDEHTFDSPDSRLEGGWIGETKIYKYKHNYKSG
jgi:hypothetical protein